MPDESGQTRRTRQLRTRGRSKQVVERVVGATIAELGRVGYEAMRVEDVATRSGVNKTTIYRRWPTKAQLVTAVVEEAVEQRTPIDTGTLRGDLRASLLGGFKLKPSEQGVLRIMQMERSIAEVESLAHKLRAAIRQERIAMVQRGVDRGELPEGVDVELVVDLLSAPVQRALLLNEAIDSEFVERMLDVVLDGAATRVGKTGKTGPKAAAKRSRAAPTKRKKTTQR